MGPQEESAFEAFVAARSANGPEIGVTVRILDADGEVLAETPLEGR